jgi:hypothetical protein
LSEQEERKRRFEIQDEKVERRLETANGKGRVHHPSALVRVASITPERLFCI